MSSSRTISFGLQKSFPQPLENQHSRFVDGVTAAAIGAITGAVIVLGRRTIFENGWKPDLFKVALMLVTLGILWTTKKVPEPLIILGAAILGLIAFPILK